MSGPRTLCFDVGGTAIKAGLFDASRALVGEGWREPTPRPAGPDAVIAVLLAIAGRAEGFERVAVGFPGVVRGGTTLTAPNLDAGWAGVDLAGRLAAALGAEVRVVNDADMAGASVIEGRGMEMVLTFGTGMGAAVYIDGTLVPNLELGHHPFGDGQTYEERVSDATLAAVGEEAWRERVNETIAQIRPIWNFRRLYLGGGNARLLDASTLPDDVRVVDNRAGIEGGVALWADAFRTASANPA